MIRLLSGDARDVLPTLPAESVQCVVTSPPYYALRSYLNAAHPDKHREIGSEATPDAYLATMVAVFRELRRVLRKDGTCWVNMGDSYAANGVTGRNVSAPSATFHGGAADPRQRCNKSVPSGLKPKDLLLMPARLALALQADGWWVRSDIIWHKPNPMPESVTDRCVSAHEHVFMLTKAPRYYFDSDAIRQEPSGSLNPIRSFGSCPDRQDNGRSYVLDGMKGAACRNVWTIATHAYPDAHFATFPPELAERCIKAGTSERGCCAACGKPWARVTERQDVPELQTARQQHLTAVQRKGYPTWTEENSGSTTFGLSAHEMPRTTTTGWSPGCQCGAEVVPCTVLDPFAGAGTTLLVADRLQRDAIGIELNTAYTEMAMERCRADAPLFTSFPPAEPPEDERMGDLFSGDEYDRPKSLTTPRNDGNRWNENNGRGFMPRQAPDMAAD